jgi:pimeloyl-ACP methyl ester carboxylesterase
VASASTKRKIAATALAVVPASFAAAGALVYWRYRRDLRAAVSRVSSGSRLVSTSCGAIEYADADAGTGAPVLVIHGAGGGFDQGLEFAQPLIEQGFRVIAPSRFGYLRTPLPPDASPMAQADAHARLLDALQLDKVAVIGVSAGAPSAMQFCLRHPQRCSSLVLAVPLAYSDQSASAQSLSHPQSATGASEEALVEGAPHEEHHAFKEFLLNAMLSSNFAYWALSKLAPKAMIRTILGTPPEDLEKAGADEQARVLEFLGHIQPISRRKKGLENETAIARSLARYDLERIEVPTLVIAVENCLYNTYPGARYTAENIPGARLRCWPTGGHLAVGHTEELWAEVENFLQSAMKTVPRQRIG